jgi:hypothetical protein
VKTFADDYIIFHDDGSDKRIGTREPAPFFSQFQSSFQPFFILIHKKTRLRSGFFIFFHPDFYRRCLDFTDSVRLLADSRTFTAGQDLHPAPKTRT